MSRGTGVVGNSGALQFWGKAGGARQNEPAWHPLPYHSLDVAAVADALLADNPRKLAVMANLLGTNVANARRFIVCLVALHDVGKFTTHFQAKSLEAWDEGVHSFLGKWQALQGKRHDHDGYVMRELLAVCDLLQPATEEWCEPRFNQLWAAITGHHGAPANDDSCPTSNVAGVNTACKDAALAFCHAVRGLFDPLQAIPEPPERNLAVLSWLLCGLTVVADWVGSNRERGWFPYRAPTLDLACYWKEAQLKACKAVTEAGLSPSALPPDVSAVRLFPELADRLSPLQQQVLEMGLPDGPLLAVIEDVTGSGKTEAALLLAARLLADDRASGLYFALPTMATANAMYARLQHAYHRIYDDGARPSLVLSHGRRMLNEAFSASVLASDPTPEGYEDGGNAACAAWIADDRRRAFLGEIGVGTIDQALLGALPSRHQAIRLWGLSDRVLIVDEAHAYDTYMNRELEALLTFQAALGGSAIVLSATLPNNQRHSLVKAFSQGLGATQEIVTDDNYPLLTSVSASSWATEPISTRPDRIRELPVRRLSVFDEAIEEITRIASCGGAVAWIRNAVDDAIEAADELRARGLTPVLLHARFAMGDRLDIEDCVCTALGREDKAGARKGFVVVGTQILEQSLDYDVDAMITDLAPIDLMIQRAGRLWRHERSNRPLGAPELVVLSPDPANVEDENWYRLLSARAAAVYSHHGIVWRSAKTLFDAGAIRTPGDVRRLIESVYGAEDLDDIPAALRKASQNSIGQAGAARTFANANLLKPEKGYGGAVDLWTKDTITPTRLGDPVTVFRLGRMEDGRIVPWYPNRSSTLAWALSEVSISKRKADGVPLPSPELAPKIVEAKDRWPEWEQQLPLLVLEPNAGGSSAWRGVVTRAGAHPTVIYDRLIGLRVGAADS